MLVSVGRKNEEFSNVLLNETQVLKSFIEDTDHKLCWEVGKKDICSFKLGIDQINEEEGLISYLEVSQVQKIYRNNAFYCFQIEKNLNGVPIIGLSNWPSKLFDSPKKVELFHFYQEFVVFVYSSSLVIDWGGPKRTTQQMVSDRIKFGFDNYNFLCSIEISLPDRVPKYYS